MEPGDRPAAADVRSAFAARFHHGVAMAMLVAVAFIQTPGKIVSDTKIDLVVAPWRFLERGTNLWEPLTTFGQVQNQAYGYLFPMGPFFGLGWSANLPEWVIQRSWWALLLVVAYSGLVVLGHVMHIGSHWPLMLGGLAYALSPRMISIIGPSSIEVWPMAVAPWVLVPLVLASRGWTPWVMAAASALAVACVGGVNAVATFAVIPPAVLWILFMHPGRARRRLMLLWPVFVLVGTLWWLVPLFLLGTYSPPFLDFIESSSLTTFSATILDALRGTSNWTSYLSVTSSAGHAMVTQSLTLLNLAVLVGVGIHGLAMRSTPHRRYLAACLLVGLTLVTLGHTASHGGWGAPAIQDMLDGALSPLRNTHKFDVLVRLPLVLAMVAAVDRYSAKAPAALRSMDQWPRRGVVFLAVAGVLGSTSLAWSGQIAPAGAFDEVPGYWHDAAEWLDDQDDGTALLLQASSFASYNWGRINDEPLQALAGSPWAVRNAIPLTEPGTIRMLDVISARLRDQDASGLRELLASNGVRYLIIRNDLVAGLDDMRVELAYATIGALNDVPRVAAFGPEVTREPYEVEDGHRNFFDSGWQQDHRAIEVYEVRGSAEALATSYQDVPTVVGSAESLPGVFESGLAAGSVTFAHDRTTDEPPAHWLLTDGSRRQEVAFGRVHSNRSASMGDDESFRSERRVHDYLSPGEAGWNAVRDLRGAEQITASSSQAWVDSTDVIDTSTQPWSAFDGDPGTAWRASSNDIGKPSWIRVEFEEPRRLGDVRIVLDADVLTSTEITVRSDNEVRTTSVSGSLSSTIAVDDDATRALQISAPSTSESLLAIRDIEIDGVSLSRPLVLADVPESWSAPDAIMLDATAGYRTGCLTIDDILQCQPDGDGWGEDGRAIDREFTLPAGDRYGLELEVEPTGGPDLDRLVQADALYSVSASSQVTRAASAGATNVLDDDTGTAWVASTEDTRPVLRVSWLGERRVSRVRLTLADEVAASRPVRVTLRFSDGTSVDRTVGEDGMITFPARESSWIDFEFTENDETRNVTSTGRIGLLPVGVSELRVAGVTPPRSFSGVVRSWECGSGPNISINRVDSRTRLVASVAQLRAGDTVRAVPCGDADVSLLSGPNRIAVHGNAVVRAERLILRNDAASEAASTGTSLSARVTATRITAELPSREELTLVRIAQNANEAWVSDSAAGRTVVNGWQQGWLVEPGSADTFEATVGPQRLYRAGLLVGAVLAGLLAVVGAFGLTRVRARRDRSVLSLGARSRRDAALLALGVASAGLMGGWTGVLAAASGAVLLVVLSRRFDTGTFPALVVAVVAALSAAWPWGTSRAWFGTFDWPQFALLFALGSLLATFRPERTSRSR